MTNLVQAWTAARDRLKAARVDSPVIDARLPRANGDVLITSTRTGLAVG